MVEVLSCHNKISFVPEILGVVKILSLLIFVICSISENKIVLLLHCTSKTVRLLYFGSINSANVTDLIIKSRMYKVTITHGYPLGGIYFRGISLIRVLLVEKDRPFSIDPSAIQQDE